MVWLFQDFYDLKALANLMVSNRNKATDGRTISWLHIRALKFIRGSVTMMRFKVRLDGEWGEIRVRGTVPLLVVKLISVIG